MHRFFFAACAAAWLAAPLTVSAQEATSANEIDCHVKAIDEVPVPASESGILVGVEVTEGQTIDEDQLVAQIDDREAVMAKSVAMYQYLAAKKQAENPISIEAAVKSQEVSKAELDKAMRANDKISGSFSDIDVRRLKLTYERNGLQIELAKFENAVAAAEALARLEQYKQAEAMIERRKLLSPHPGMVIEVFKHKGDWVNAGDPIAHLVRMDKLRVQGRVSWKAHHWKDLKDRAVEITVDLPGGQTEVVNATIGFASAYVEGDGAYRVWADVPNRRVGQGWLMGPGLTATMRLR